MSEMLKRSLYGISARRGNVPPISEDGRAGIARLLAKALNRNQRLILESISQRHQLPITTHLKSISAERRVPLSTLKLNAKVLKDLQLIVAADGNSSLTQAGDEALELLHLNEKTGHPNQEVN